jgi:hypothetical protein
MALTMKEQQRVAVIERVFRGQLTMAETAMVLGVSEGHSFGSRPGPERRACEGRSMAMAAVPRLGSCPDHAPTDCGAGVGDVPEAQ